MNGGSDSFVDASYDASDPRRHSIKCQAPRFVLEALPTLAGFGCLKYKHKINPGGDAIDNPSSGRSDIVYTIGLHTLKNTRMRTRVNSGRISMVSATQTSQIVSSATVDVQGRLVLPALY